MIKEETKDKKLVCCIGNNLATMIGVSEMAKAGHSVKLFTDGGKLGGFFSGISIEEKDFDLGMILLETFDENNKHNESERSSINSWLTLGGKVSKWLNNQVDLYKVDTPEVYIFGKKYPDYIMSNRLDLLENSDMQLAENIDFDNDLHASNKEYSKIFDEISYAEASKYNHGNDFHYKCIEPLIKKVTSYNSDDFLARYHRFSWAPLYYPETINSAIAGKIFDLKEYNFWTTTAGFVGDLVATLKKQIYNMDNVEVIDKKISSITFQDNILNIDRELFYTDHKTLLGLGIERTLDLLNSKDHEVVSGDGVNVTIGLALAHRDSIDHDDKSLFIVDEEYGSYRISNQDATAGLNPEWHRISIEANSDILKNKYHDLSLDEAIKVDLSRFLKLSNEKDLKFLKVINVKNAFYLPTKAFVNNKKFLSNTISSLTDGSAFLSGDLVGYGSSSVNNQIMQGLNYMEKTL